VRAADLLEHGIGRECLSRMYHKGLLQRTKPYIWTVWHTVTLKVWMDGHKRNHWIEVLNKFDDPRVNFKELASGQLKQTKESTTPVTPKLVSELIIAATDMNFLLNSSPHKLIIKDIDFILEQSDV